MVELSTELEFNQQADSTCIWEPEGGEINYENFSFVNHDIKVIESNIESLGINILLEVLLNIRLIIEGHFRLSHTDSIDGDVVDLDAITKEIEKDFETKVHILISCDSTRDINNVDDLEIVDVTIIDQLGTVDFGELEQYDDTDHDEEI
ncbi:hypothetical protein QE177_11500 [Arsenophonus sp. aPb]|uniref:hypothetical protein n=1 Tax=Arsenophonus sp. aPb TaxID=3041619 RepID=UPI00246899D2|nr:hypothetical protein [Arsenophonus sp. aPb]WGL97815.1 hypothetical protein QE177_11500 [Arsenophonus sp. aPb]